LVISDGAPVDDSTLQVNHSHILEDHVIAVVRALEESSDIRVAAIGIGFDVSRYYVNASTVKVPEDLGVAVIDQLERLLLPPQSAMPGEAET
jgi:cobaltochelatase CobT